MTISFSNILNVLSFSRFKKILVIDISVTMLKLAGFESSLTGLRLTCFETKIIDPAMTFGEQAESVIKDFLARHRQLLSGCEVILSISQADGVFVKYLVLPNLPADEILGAAKWQIKEEASFDLESAAIDFQKVAETIDEQGVKQYGYVFYLVQKEILDAYLEILEHCRLLPSRVTIAAFDYARIILEQGGQEHVAVVLDLNEKNAFLSFYFNNHLVFLRRLPMSWEKVSQAMLEPVASDRGMVRFSAEDQLRVKSMPGLLIGDTGALAHDLHAVHAASLIRPFLETLVREIKFSIAYFGSSFLVDKPKILYLTGAVSDLKDLELYLKGELALEVVLLNSSRPVVIVQPLCQEFAGQQKILSAVVGAALNGRAGIDLLPFALKQRRALQTQKMVIRLTVLILSLFLFSSWGFSLLRQKDYHRQIENARIHLQAMGAIQQLNAQIIARQGLWQKIVRNKVPGDMVLRVISERIPDGIILDQISFDQVAKEVKISGSLFAPAGRQAENQLIDFVQRLDETDLFLSATLLSTKKGPGSDQFEISCTVAGGI